MNIDELTKKFREEDKNWSLEVLLKWLIEKKGIPKEIASVSIQATLIEMESGKLKIDSHHGQDGFDNIILRNAKEYIQQANDLTLQMLNKDLEERMKNLTGGGRWSKLWRVFRGKL